MDAISPSRREPYPLTRKRRRNGITPPARSSGVGGTARPVSTETSRHSPWRASSVPPGSCPPCGSVLDYPIGGVGMIGRTSIEPVRDAGMPTASLIASSRSFASTM